MFNCQQMFSMPAQLHISQKYLPRLIAVSLLSWPLAQAQGIDPGARMLGDLERARRAAEQNAPLTAPPTLEAEPLQELDFTGRVQFREIQFTPSELLSADTLRELANSVLDRDLTSNDLKGFLQSIQKRYLAMGVEHAAPLLPPQDLKSGVLRILLVEGRLGQIRASEGLDIDLDRLRAWWRQAPGQVIRSTALLEDLAVLNAATELNLQGQLVAGSEFAQSDWLLSMPEGGRWSRWAQMDWTEGERNGHTGRQLMAGLKLAPAGRWAQRLDTTIIASPSAQTLSMNLGWPLSARGWRLSTGLSRSQSSSSVPSSTASAPDLKVEGRSGTEQIDLGYWFEPMGWDLLRGTAQLARWTSRSTSADQVISDRHVQRLNLALTGDWRTHVGDVPQAVNLNWRTSWTLGQGTSGAYSFVEANMSGNWLLNPANGLQARVNATVRLRNTRTPDAMDGWLIGGPASVRGFALGSAAGHSGHAVQLSLVRPWQLAEQGGEWMLLTDQGSARIGSDAKVLSSSGVGMSWRIARQQSLEAQYTRQGRGHAGVNIERLLLRLNLAF